MVEVRDKVSVAELGKEMHLLNASKVHPECVMDRDEKFIQGYFVKQQNT